MGTPASRLPTCEVSRAATNTETSVSDETTSWTLGFDVYLDIKPVAVVVAADELFQDS